MHNNDEIISFTQGDIAAAVGLKNATTEWLIDGWNHPWISVPIDYQLMDSNLNDEWSLKLKIQHSR